jgi:hypothetical protein
MYCLRHIAWAHWNFKDNKDRVVPIPVAVRSKAWVCGRSLTGIVGSNPAKGMDVCLL